MPKSINISTTAILLFNYAEKQKASLRKISPGINNRGLSCLIDKLNNKTRKLSKKAQLPFFQVNADSELDFGVQLFQAYEKLFDKGFDHVIGISNDCPALHENDLIKSAELLPANDMVLGPAKDGGLYLFALKKGALTKNEFLSLSWQSSELFSDIQTLFVKKGLNVEKLTPKSDMDTVSDFHTAFRSHFFYLDAIKSQLFSYVKGKFKALQSVEIKYGVEIVSLRAPPFCS